MVKITVDPNKKFQKALEKGAKESTDLTLPLTLIAQSWFKTNKAIFALKGPGKYTDLKRKNAKLRRAGFLYPILEGDNGRIKDGITNPASSYSVSFIKNKKELFVGVQNSGGFPYFRVHQLGSTKLGIPARPFLFSGGEQSAPDFASRRVEKWIKIITNHITKAMNKRV